MKKTFILGCSLFAIGTILLTSCDNRPDISGVWVGTPVRIDNIAAADQANATMTFVFTNDSSSKSDCGEVSVSALIDVNQAVSSSDSFIDSPYEVSVAATVAIDGRWTYEDSEYDDIIIVLDPQTMKVRVDPHGVTFSDNILTSSQQPVADSLSNATAEAWTKSISAAMSVKFHGISKISDIKINNGIMSCEINDRDYTFRKVNE